MSPYETIAYSAKGNTNTEHCDGFNNYPELGFTPIQSIVVKSAEILADTGAELEKTWQWEKIIDVKSNPNTNSEWNDLGNNQRSEFILDILGHRTGQELLNHPVLLEYPEFWKNIYGLKDTEGGITDLSIKTLLKSMVCNYRFPLVRDVGAQAVVPALDGLAGSFVVRPEPVLKSKMTVEKSSEEFKVNISNEDQREWKMLLKHLSENRMRDWKDSVEERFNQ